MQETKTYSAGDMIVDRAPNPLSIFNVGLDKRLGNQVAIHHGFVPTLWDTEMHGSDTTFLNIFFAIDIVFVFEVVLSLMALLFAYDAICGGTRVRDVTLAPDASRPSKSHPVSQIYECHGVSPDPAIDKPIACDNFTDRYRFDFLKNG